MENALLKFTPNEVKFKSTFESNLPIDLQERSNSLFLSLGVSGSKTILRKLIILDAIDGATAGVFLDDDVDAVAALAHARLDAVVVFVVVGGRRRRFNVSGSFAPPHNELGIRSRAHNRAQAESIGKEYFISKFESYRHLPFLWILPDCDWKRLLIWPYFVFGGAGPIDLGGISAESAFQNAPPGVRTQNVTGSLLRLVPNYLFKIIPLLIKIPN